MNYASIKNESKSNDESELCLHITDTNQFLVVSWGTLLFAAYHKLVVCSIQFYLHSTKSQQVSPQGAL